MTCFQAIRMCQAESPRVQTDCGSEALHRNDIQKSVTLTIPKGGSISFEHIDKNGAKGAISDLPSGVSSYTQYNGHYELNKIDGGKHSVDITGEIKSLNAVIRYADGKVFWSGDLMKVGKAEERKEEAKKETEDKKADDQKVGADKKSGIDTLRMPPVKDNAIKPAVEADTTKKAPFTDPIEDSDVNTVREADKLFNLITNGATASNPGYDGDLSSTFEEVPPDQVKSKPTPKATTKDNSLDMSKLEPGTTVNYTVHSTGAVGSFVVPSDQREFAAEFHGNLRYDKKTQTYAYSSTDGEVLDFKVGNKVAKGEGIKLGSQVSNQRSSGSSRSQDREGGSRYDGPKLYIGQLNEVQLTDLPKILEAYPDKKIFIDVSSPSCGLCPDYADKLRSEAQKYDEKVIFLKVETDGYAQSLRLGNFTYDIRSYPYNVVLKGPNTFHGAGTLSIEQIRDEIGKL